LVEAQHIPSLPEHLGRRERGWGSVDMSVAEYTFANTIFPTSYKQPR